MQFQLFIFLLAVIAAVQLTQSATLRRKPKVYNALITTDQNLTPSRAFPVIQSHLQETYAYPSYSYRSYSPLGLYNNGFQYGSAPAASSIGSYNGFHSYPRINTGLVEARNYFPRDEIHTTLPPIRNDFGVPPSLVPINSFPFGNLAPYPYHSYPIVYDQFGGYESYLPPYPFYPPGFDGTKNPDKEKDGKDEKDKKDDDGSDAPAGESSGGGADRSSGGSSGSSGGGSGSSGGSSGSSGGSGGGASGGSGSASSGGGSSGGGSSSSSTSTSSTKSSRSRNFDNPEHPQQQSLNENIKNFPNKDPSIPDIDPSPPVRVKSLNK